MRDKRFVTVHRGGLLTKEQHRILIKWARRCSKHVLPLLGNNIDNSLIAALDIAEEWIEDKATVGDARKASVDAHAVARQSRGNCSYGRPFNRGSTICPESCKIFGEISGSRTPMANRTIITRNKRNCP